jgi:excisionase family DNA binding protein
MRDSNTAIASTTGEPRLLYKVGEAAKLLNVSEPTVYRLMASGELPYTKLNRRIRRIRHDDLMSLIERNTLGG